MIPMVLMWKTFARKRVQSLFLVGCCALPSFAYGIDWDNFRGPAGDGISPEQGVTPWGANGPNLRWKTSLNNGFSTFSAHGGRIFTQVTRNVNGDEKEVCLALDNAIGKELWSAVIDHTGYDSGSGDGDGPRSTPVYYNGHLFVFSSFLTLVSLDAGTGAEIWRKDLAADFGGTVIGWQNSASPVIEDGRIFLNANGSPHTCLALSTEDGSVLWQATTEKMTHATPLLATIFGTRQIIFFTQYGLVSLQPADGKELWRFAFRYNGTSFAASPVVYNDMVYCSAAYGTGAAVVRIGQENGKFTVTQLWKKTSLMNHWGTPVCQNGYLYGLYGYSAYYSAPLKCIDMATGEEKWSQSNFGMGGLILADGKLLVQSEGGEIAMVAATPDSYQELARFQAVEGKCWNAPILSNGRLYARSVSESASYELFRSTAAPLRWMSLQRIAPGRFQWFVGSTDNSAIDAARLSKISVLSSSKASTDAADWTVASYPMTLTNGQLVVEGAFDTSPPQRFFKIAEQQ